MMMPLRPLAVSLMVAASRLVSFSSDLPPGPCPCRSAKALATARVSTRTSRQLLGNKVNFILDATLGMINIDQNNILKIFSVVTVFLLPPSVIGAIFGMNFQHIPLSAQPEGFWIAIGLMVLSALLPWLEFKRRGWL